MIIIDDEPSVAAAVQLLCAHEALGITGIGTAINGADALEQMEKEPADIILLDMNMPVMDGVSFLREAARRFPDVKIIVISNHNDFHYAKESIQHNVVDYILKPIDGDELNASLQKAAAGVEAGRRQRESADYARRLGTLLRPLMREQVYEAYLKGRGKDDAIRRYREMLALDDAGEERTIALVKVVNYQQICEAAYQGDHSVCQYALFNIIEELLAPYQCVCIPDNDDESIVVCILRLPEINAAPLSTALGEMLSTLADYLQAQCVAAVGESKPADALPLSYEFARRALELGEAGDTVILSEGMRKSGRQVAYAAKAYIDTHFSENIKVAQLSGSYYMSRENFARLFREAFGESPRDYLIRVRMEKARELIRQGMRISQVAERVGYSNLNYFSKAFRTQWGHSPTEYREP